MIPAESVRVHGEASPEEIAALLAALRETGGYPTADASPYERWRAQRIAITRVID